MSRQPLLSSDDTACFAFDQEPDAYVGYCSCGHTTDDHEGELGGCRECAYDDQQVTP